MSSENDVIAAELAVDVFCSVTVTMEVTPSPTVVGANALLTRMDADAALATYTTTSKHAKRLKVIAMRRFTSRVNFQRSG